MMKRPAFKKLVNEVDSFYYNQKVSALMTKTNASKRKQECTYSDFYSMLLEMLFEVHSKRKQECTYSDFYSMLLEMLFEVHSSLNLKATQQYDIPDQQPLRTVMEGKDSFLISSRSMLSNINEAEVEKVFARRMDNCGEFHKKDDHVSESTKECRTELQMLQDDPGTFGKAAEAVKKHQAVEMAFTLYPPHEAKPLLGAIRQSTWVNPIVDGEEGYRYLDKSCAKVKYSTKPAKIESSVSSKVLESVLHELNGLKEFLDKNSQFTPGSLGSTSFSTPANLQQRLLGFMRPDGGSSQQVQQDLQRKYHTEAQAYEKISLQGIQQLVHRTCQTLALWKLICDHQFSVIIADLQKLKQPEPLGFFL
ncbi:Nuclear pore complex protein Nup155 [Acipenser ruthenus]|uniref:Nuclear pore complex protein Nup155 n=1 Tax=Acipenser ruthenus TaxID=7906 RepID=A0A444UGT5_ACIRT|nr:Nuclear pore complex protein Nup155 [Acipenser ruthenus]